MCYIENHYEDLDKSKSERVVFKSQFNTAKNIIINFRIVLVVWAAIAQEIRLRNLKY